ncbi:amidohydrolase family protein [Luteolibacter soli]|uniref:Amidohydrolase family protein n=1 Tax=Luteolibacter soli TaxID=3135280 RepID=A0ABU9AV56_9BACT
MRSPHRPIITRALLIGTAFSLLPACTQKEPPPPVALPTDKDSVTLIEKTPVIDVHTHTFNARFLPVKGIALGKRDIHPLLSLASDELVIAIANLIVWTTPKSPDPSDKRHLSPSDRQPNSRLMEDLARSVNRDAMALQGNRKPRSITPEKVASEPAVQGYIKLKTGESTFDNLSAPEKARLTQVVKMFGDGSATATQNREGKDEIKHFIDTLTSDEAAMEGLFRLDHTIQRKRQVDLIVSHMMDMAPTYNQPEDGKDLLKFERQQIPRVNRQQQKANGNMLYFAAYSPFRDQWGEGAAKGHALQIVKDAYHKQGAFGVKVYPPSGYAPSGNVIPHCPFSFASQPCEQWKARYKPNGVKLDPTVLDDRLLELFRWCVAEDVPVFTHCGTGEFQARKGYAKLAHPQHWKRLLTRHPELSNLRLCFGHAGAGGFWFDSSEDADWGRTVYELCCQYPNVYCEFGCFDAIADPVARANFTRQLASLIKKSHDDQTPFQFSKKIMYGSDWFMPMPAAADRVNYLNSFRVAILKAGGPQPAELYRRFFFKNALDYLNAPKRIQKGGLPPALKLHLNSLLDM